MPFILPSVSSPSSSSLPLPPSMCSWLQHTLRAQQRRRQSTWPGKCLSPSHMRFAAVTNALLCWSLSWSAPLWCLKTFNGQQITFLPWSVFCSFYLVSFRMFQFAKWFWSESKRKSVFVERGSLPILILDILANLATAQTTLTTWSFSFLINNSSSDLPMG